MKCSEVFAFLFIQGIFGALALPQGGHYSTLNHPNLQPFRGGQPPFPHTQKFEAPAVVAAAATQNIPYAVPPPQVDYDYQIPSTSNIVNTNYIQAPCDTITLPNGDIKINCRAQNPQDLTLRTKHILWISPETQGSKNYQIEIDNYKLEELIQAGFKGPSLDTSSKFNILVKRPQVNYDAQVEKLKASAFNPTINLQYEPVKDLQVHYPVDKVYSTLRGPIDRPSEGPTSLSPRYSRNPQQPANNFLQNQPSNNFQHYQPAQNVQFRPSIQTPFQPQSQRRSS